MQFRLQLILDRYRDPEHLAPLLSAGVDCVQIRIRDDSTKRLLGYVRSVVNFGRQRGAVVLVNSRLDVALAADADGVHLARNGIRPSEVRSIAPNLFISASVHTRAAATSAAVDGADAITFGHVFASASHPGDPPQGPPKLREIVDAVDIPVIAIGGIGPDNVRSVRETGAAAVAVITSIWDARDRVSCVHTLQEGMGR